MRRLESEQCLVHVKRLSAFLPGSFLRPGGDNDALLALLFIDRMCGKYDLLANHVGFFIFYFFFLLFIVRNLIRKF